MINFLIKKILGVTKEELQYVVYNKNRIYILQEDIMDLQEQLEQIKGATHEN